MGMGRTGPRAPDLQYRHRYAANFLLRFCTHRTNGWIRDNRPDISFWSVIAACVGSNGGSSKSGPVAGSDSRE